MQSCTSIQPIDHSSRIDLERCQTVESPFPTEIFRKIFSLCSVSDLRRLSLVSKVFCEHAEDEVVWELFYKKLDLGICKSNKIEVKWKELYRINTEFEKYANGEPFSFLFATQNIFGVYTFVRTIKPKINQDFSMVTGRHLKQIIRKSEGLAQHLSQIVVSVITGDQERCIDDMELLKSSNLKGEFLVCVKKFCPICYG